MEIEQIYSPYIYSIKYDEEEDNEYDRLFQLWNDVDYVVNFMSDNSNLLTNAIWSKTPEPENAARQVLEETFNLEDLFDKLHNNTINGNMPDFDNHFRFLNGKYRCKIEYLPMKSYSTDYPPMLRLYAIKMDPNTYLITGGGIKLGKTIQNSPDLKDHVLQNIDKVRTWLRENGIMDSNDMDN